jgi:AraC family transcriptional regulator
VSALPVSFGTARAATAELKGYRVSDIAFPPALRLASHAHERACLAVVLDGSVDKRFGRRTLPSPYATVLTMPPEEEHADRFSGRGARIVVVEPDARTAEMLASYGAGLGRVTHRRDGAATLVSARIAAELAAPDPLTPLALEGLVLELVAVAARRPAVGTRPPVWLRDVVELLHERFAEPLRVTDIAATVGVHPVHLARVFREHRALSIGGYVRRLRLDWAATRLASTDDPLCSIAFDAGFADQSHFTRAFKTHSGLTPGAYRTAVQ